MARKKAQEVQEVINGHKLDPQTAIKLEPALRLMRKAAAYFGTPIEKTSLADASKMLKEPAEKIASLNIDGITGEVIATAEKALGKKAKDITTADIENSFVSIELPGTENIDIDTPDGAKILAEKLSAAFKEISESPEYKTATAITHQTKIILSLFSEHGQQISDVIEKAAEFNDILPFIMLELAERSGDVLTIETAREILKSGEKGDKDKTPFEKKIDHVLDQFTFAGEPTTDFAKELLEAANKRKTDFYDSQEFIEVIDSVTKGDTPGNEQIKKQLPNIAPRIIAQQAESVDYPLDKPNSKLWELLTTTDPNGQLTIDFDTTKNGSDKKVSVYYSINFTALESMKALNITKQLTPFDKRVYIIAAALFNAGNKVITATQIYKADHDKEPSEKDIKKIQDSITKMGAAHIYINNKSEIDANYGYPPFEYDASLLPFERLTVYSHGKLAEAAIHLLREPPLITFARDRKQITTIDRQILLAPINKTEANLRIEDYLIERISHMKNEGRKTPQKMLYETIFSECGITEKKQKQRAPEKIRRFLDYYKECNLIKKYTEAKEGIIITIQQDK